MNNRSDIDMEGVQIEVSLLSVRDTPPVSSRSSPIPMSNTFTNNNHSTSNGDGQCMRDMDEDESMNCDEDEDDENSMVPGLSEDEGSDLENDDDDEEDDHSLYIQQHQYQHQQQQQQQHNQQQQQQRQQQQHQHQQQYQYQYQYHQDQQQRQRTQQQLEANILHDITVELLNQLDNSEAVVIPPEEASTTVVAPATTSDDHSRQLNEQPLHQSSSANSPLPSTSEPSHTSSSPSSHSVETEPSIISIPEAIYSAVPVSAELHIIPHSSKGFRWNEDLFMKAQERHNLGVDDMYLADGGSVLGVNTNDTSITAGGVYPYDSILSVHEIRLDEDESQQILPS